MKASLIVLLALTITTIGSVSAKQAETTPSPRVISQEEGLTVGDQSNKPADVAVTKQIRTELMKDDSLSTKGKNVKIIVLNNGVTLKGDVRTEDERARILKHAYVTAPKHKIYNQLTVIK